MKPIGLSYFSVAYGYGLMNMKYQKNVLRMNRMEISLPCFNHSEMNCVNLSGSHSLKSGYNQIFL